MKKSKEEEILIEKWKYATIPTIKPLREKINCRDLISVGSCFSRNLNRWLMHFGLTERQMPWSILYNPFSIAMEIIRLFEKVDWQDNVIHETNKKGKMISCKDPWRTWKSFKTIPQLIEFNRQFDVIAKNTINQATGFMFTFGLSEVWSYGDDIKITVNQLPVNTIFGEKCPWRLRFASVNEILDITLKMVKSIRENFGNSVPIIFTLSPVPLKYSFSGLSIREANNISKSTILLALHQVSQAEKDVHYFPVYEIVQALVEQDFPVWQKDGRHVTAATIDFIVKQFLVNFSNDKIYTDSFSDFWVPFVNDKGRVSGRLYVDGKVVLNE